MNYHGSDSDMTWATWYCSLRGNEYFCEVDDDYLFDRFNSMGLQEYVKDYDTIIDSFVEEPGEMCHSDSTLIQACKLYGLIHARFILTSRGQQKMIDKFRHMEFGICTLHNCEFQALLPIGLSDTPNVCGVRLFCPKCGNLYIPRSSRHCQIDGACFGTTFPHLLLMVYPEFRPTPNDYKYVPKIFGFAVHPKSYEVTREHSIRGKNA